MPLSIPSSLGSVIQFVGAVVLPLFFKVFNISPFFQWRFPSQTALVRSQHIPLHLMMFVDSLY
jgi:hypothetical protein